MNKLNNKKSVLITPDVIDECLSESFGIQEKHSQSQRKNKRHIG